VRYSALHGIAEVKSPVMKISTRTDATAGESIVEWEGSSYPPEGAVGLHFPFRAPAKPMLTRSPGYRRGLAHVVQTHVDPTHADQTHVDQTHADQSWRHADNGFSSDAAMEELHRPIVALARAALQGVSGNILDLGCGNGMLLGKICENRPDLVPYGIDSNGAAIARAREILPEFAQNLMTGDIFDTGLFGERRKYALVLLMPGRLLEVPEKRAALLIAFLRSSCSKILAYAYPDWRQHPLHSILRQFGLEPEDPGPGTAFENAVLLKDRQTDSQNA
jgi:hypothetical protein